MRRNSQFLLPKEKLEFLEVKVIVKDLLGKGEDSLDVPDQLIESGSSL